MSGLELEGFRYAILGSDKTFYKIWTPSHVV